MSAFEQSYLMAKTLQYRKKALLTVFILLVANLTNFTYAQSWNEIIKTVASDRANFDAYGYSVAISGDYAVVGAVSEDEDAAGGNTLSSAGAAYILQNNAGIWTEVQKITASDREANAQFGFSVAIDGDYAIISARLEDKDASGGNTISNSGAAYLFENNAGTWAEVQKIVASDRGANDYFGHSVSISGNYAVVGAYYEDQDASGSNTLTNSGSAYIFENNAGTWTQTQKIVASDRGANDYFGHSVSISSNFALVGAYWEDEDATGGNTVFNSGSAYIYENNAGTWTQTQKIVASDRSSGGQFGFSVEIDGNYAIIGANYEDLDEAGGNLLSNAGSAYIFENNSGTWMEMQKIVASDRGTSDQFGFSVAINGNYLVVGAFFEDEDAIGANTITNSGSAYIFENNAGVWTQTQKIVGSDRGPGANDVFGTSVALSGDFAIVGARSEDEDALGGNTLSNSGATYIFNRTSPLPIELVYFNAQSTNNRSVSLEWETATEVNNDFFTIERSKFGLDWELIDTIRGAGNSTTTLTYKITDLNPYYGTSYYRLKQTDFDGQFEYADIKSVDLGSDKPFNINVYPNPNTGTFTLESESICENYTIMNAQGRIVNSGIIENQHETISLEEEVVGVYYLSVENRTLKIVKQ
jgi:hypothetical protein